MSVVIRDFSVRVARRRRVREMHRRLAQLDRLDRRHGLGTLPGSAPSRRRPRSHGAFWPSLLVSAAVLAGVVLLTPGVSGHRVRALIGLGDSRLNSAVQARHEGGQFRFQMTQPGSSDPVSYNPCREIGWATPDEVPGLAGRVAGLGGSSAVQRTPAHLAYVTGVVALDRDSFAEMSERPEGFDLERAILMHELGHVVGLAHVEDPGELMYDDNVGQTSFGPGDREGLALLGQADCL